ncbi:MAG: hypothetical protein NZM44_07665 [Candidatus Calescibacterium sp.]|nr:hypothetical protein [Candidatus Calescibacterium sp.]
MKLTIPFSVFSETEQGGISRFLFDFEYQSEQLVVYRDYFSVYRGTMEMHIFNSEEFKEKFLQYLDYLKRPVVIFSEWQVSAGSFQVYVRFPKAKYLNLPLLLNTIRDTILSLSYIPIYEKNHIIDITKTFSTPSENERVIRVFSSYMVVMFPEIIDIINILLNTSTSSQLQNQTIRRAVKEIITYYLEKTDILRKVVKHPLYVVSKEELTNHWKRKENIVDTVKEFIELIKSSNFYTDEEVLEIVTKVVENTLSSDALEVIKMFFKNSALIRKVFLTNAREEFKREAVEIKNVEQFRNLLERYKRKMKKVSMKQIYENKSRLLTNIKQRIEKKLTFGGDPEFSIIHQDNWIEADRVIFKNTKSIIGTDGDGRILEIRPQYANTPEELLLNFYITLKHFTIKTKEGVVGSILDIFDAIGSDNHTLPLGGHIHVGGKTKLMADFLEYQSGRIIQNINKKIFKVLYDLSTDERKRKSYMYDNAEDKPYGFEYRTPPSTIWLNPKLFFAITELIKLTITEEYIKTTDPIIFPKIKSEINKRKKVIVNRIVKNSKKLVWRLNSETLRKYSYEIYKMKIKKPRDGKTLKKEYLTT